MSTLSHPILRLLLLVSLCSFTEARAQSSNSAPAQALFEEAKALIAEGRAPEACPKLEESQRLDPRSGTLINLADCYERTGQLASAWARYIDAAVASAPAYPEREAVARERAAALVPRLSRLVIVVPPALKSLPGLEVQRDGIVVGPPAWGVGLPSDSGPHRIVVSAPGYQPSERRVNVAGEAQTTTVELAPLSRLVIVESSPPSPTASQGLGTARTAAIVAGGVGIVGVGLGAAFGLVAMSKHDEAEKYCDGASCVDRRGLTAGDSARTAGNVSTVAMLVGGVCLAAGATLWLTAPSPRRDAPSAQVGLSVGTLQIQGKF